MTKKEEKELKKIRMARIINANDTQTARELGFKSRSAMYHRFWKLDTKQQLSEMYHGE